MLKFVCSGKLNTETDFNALAQAAGILPQTAMCLYARGATDPEKIKAFLNPSISMLHDPMLLPDMQAAVRRINQAVDRNEKICIYGDYDADGICATSILLLYLKRRNANVTYHIPSRHSEGYGMNCQTVERLGAEGVNLIITVDNGISAFDEIALCRSLGMDAIVTDHHQCKDAIPECVAVVNPKRSDNVYPNPDLCGAGVAFKLVQAMAGVHEAIKYIVPACIATVSDIVPLLGENRAIVSLGLKHMNSGDFAQRGIEVLAKTAKSANTPFTTFDIGFGIGPRLNAGGRMGDASVGVELICTDDEQRMRELAAELNSQNELRKSEEAAILAQAEAMLQASDSTGKRSVILESADWNPGIIGIVASRLAEKYCKPAILFCNNGGILTGSGRSVPDVDLFKALDSQSRFFLKYGGHRQAAGVTMRESEYNEFRAEFDKYLIANYSASVFVPANEYELETELDDLSLRLAQEIRALEPFGEGNPQPAFLVRGVELSSVKKLGADGAHFRATVIKNQSSAEAVAFGKGKLADQYTAGAKLDIIFTPALNTWNDVTRLQLVVKAIKKQAYSDLISFDKIHRCEFYDSYLQNFAYMGPYAAEGIIYKPYDELLEYLNEDTIGTIVLCFTPNGAKSLLESLKANELHEHISVYAAKLPKTPVAYDSVLIAPVLDSLDLTGYRTIIAFDAPCDSKILFKLQNLAAKGASVYAPSECLHDFNELAEAFNIGRDGFKRHYAALTKCAGKLYKCEDELINYMAMSTGRPVYECRFACRVFSELEFITAAGNGAYRFNRSSLKKELHDSATFSAMAALIAKRADSGTYGEEIADGTAV